MKLDKIIQSLIRNRKITLFFVLLVIVGGTLAYVGMPKQETPDFTTPYAMITTVYPGASQNDVDLYVTAPINDTIKTIEGYKTSSSYSMDNLSLILLEFKFSADTEKAFSTLKSALVDLQKDLPESCGQISVNTNITDTSGVLISLSSDTLTNRQVVEQAKLVRDRLDGIEGFQRFEIIGKLDTVVSVKVNEMKMKIASLTLSDIVSLIQAGNADLPLGKITEDGTQMTLDYTGGFVSTDDVAALPLGYSAQLGRAALLKDIADVSEIEAERNTYFTHNGSQAVILAGYFETDINVLPLKGEIQDVLEDMTDVLPDELNVSLILSQPQEISDSLIEFMRNLLIAVILVILVVLFGMGLKNAVVVSVSLPLSVLMSFAAMNVLGIKIHQISIAALVLSLGMLVDNSIVVSDSIQNYLDAGEKRIQACAQGVKSVALPILTSTLTTIAAFAPFLFLNSLAGDYIRSLPQIVMIALTASYLSAVFVIPVLGFIFFKPRAMQNKRRGKRLMKSMLEAALLHRLSVILIVIALLGGSAYLALNLDTIFFPASEKNILYVDVRNNTSGDVQGTRVMIDAITEAIQGEPGVTEVTAAAGGALPRFNDIMYIYTQTPDIGQILLRIDIQKAGMKTNEAYMAYLQKKLDGLGLEAKITVKELMYAFPSNEDLNVRIIGQDIDRLKALEGEIFDVITGMDGFQNESRSSSDYVNVYQLAVDNTAAATEGIVPAQALNEVSIAMLGREAAVIMDGDTRQSVMVSGTANTQDALNAIALKTLNGDYITAGDIITLTQQQVLSSIPRVDADYAMSVTADYDPDLSKKETLQSLKAQIEAMDLSGARIEYDGEDKKISENFGQVGVLGLFALAAVFIILLLQFKSFKIPLIIFITIPLSAIGSAIGLYVAQQPLSFTALLGIVSLLGIVVNNAIILVDFINKELAAGVDVRTACINASLRRLRPILLSSATTVIGLIPLALSVSQLFKPMAVALMSGLLVSALLTLVVLPVFVSISGRNLAR